MKKLIIILICIVLSFFEVFSQSESAIHELTKKEINALKKQAEQIAKENEKKTDVEIEKDLKIKPDTITKILTDPKIREWIDPEFYEAFVRLSSALKKLIFKDQKWPMSS